MNDVMQLLNSPEFQKSMFWLGITSLMLAIGLIVCAFAFYGRARDVVIADPETTRWTLLMGTWRDSLIITLLFVSEALFHRFLDLIGIAQQAKSAISWYSPLVPPLASFVLMILIFVIAALRIALISRWLLAQSAPTPDPA
ncbi:hypothetical protein [Pseudophaeobacter sp.]|uniref:hypothetical protein n=1 Tax=Pseudophaeobacter sp. TaxID=1971739 RepID=UPI003296BAB1